MLKDIKGYEGLYSADDSGKIYSHKSKRFLTTGNPDSLWNYSYVCLRKNGVSKIYPLHRLIAETFIPNLEGKTIVNHKDGNGRNNCVDNLEWITQKENVAHALANNLKEKKREIRRKHWIP